MSEKTFWTPVFVAMIVLMVPITLLMTKPASVEEFGLASLIWAGTMTGIVWMWNNRPKSQPKS